ncbi:MAG: KOW domain-containing RNA-binding protein [Oscillospiraceae bacterium]|nr:KOW domain-containing RNA-binding protein [Oscillospiraceae bacterium]
MEAQVGHIVISLAGRYKERPFYVLKTEENFVYLADGRLRRIENCKKKRRRHVRVADNAHSAVGEKLRSGKEVLNSEMRKALLDFRKTHLQAEGGHLLG